MSVINFSTIKNYLEQADSALIVLGNNSGFDQQLAAASLFLALNQQKKKTALVAPEKVSNPTIVGLEELKNDIGCNDLVISFDYVETAVNNVSYHLDKENKKFYLTIKPRKGEEPLKKETVEMDYVGAEADVVILIGVNRLEDLGQLYYGYEEFYRKTNLISLSNHQPVYKSLNFNVSQASSFCEAIFQLFKDVGYKFNNEIATNLLAGIQYETNNFVDISASAETFEAVAELLRAGARRKAGPFKRVEKQAKVQENHQEEKNIFAGNRQKSKLVQLKKETLKKQSQPPLRPSGLKK
jgi:hypothetical protein